ncbi:hypothetical protein FIBSPDRAFT_860073, partial [Athelia psychrophila]
MRIGYVRGKEGKQKINIYGKRKPIGGWPRGYAAGRAWSASRSRPEEMETISYPTKEPA